MIRDALNGERDVATLSVELASAYSYLFLGAGGPRSAPPYESVYTSGSFFQNATRQNQDILERHELGIRPDVHEPADHIAVQLEMIAHLANDQEILAAAGKCVDEEKAEQKEFIETHLLNWVPAFCQDCTDRDSGGFYAGVAQIAVAMLKEDLIHLSGACGDSWPADTQCRGSPEKTMKHVENNTQVQPVFQEHQET